MTMICFSIPLLRALGASPELLAQCEPRDSGTRLAFSNLFSFGGGGGGGHDRRVLGEEFHRPDAGHPCRALLVGMSDPYGEAAQKLEADVCEVATTDITHRVPTAAEARVVVYALRRARVGLSRHPAAPELEALFAALCGEASATTQEGRRTTAVLTPEIAAVVGVDAATLNVVVARDWRWAVGDLEAHRPAPGERWDVVLIGYGPFSDLRRDLPSEASPWTVVGLDDCGEGRNWRLLRDVPGARKIWEHFEGRPRPAGAGQGWEPDLRRD